MNDGDKLRCTRCDAEIEPGFDACWKCGTSTDGVENPDFQHADNVPTDNDGFVKAINTMGFLTGAFSIRKVKASVPLCKGDFVIPGWLNPVLLGLVVYVAGFFTRGGEDLLYWLAGGVVLFLYGAIRYATGDR